MPYGSWIPPSLRRASRVGEEEGEEEEEEDEEEEQEEDEQAIIF